jgi:hypothetical protein
MVITAVILLGRASFFRELVQGMSIKVGEITISASYGLMLGIFLVVIHNIWVWQPRLVVTLVCWFIFLKSLLWLAFPSGMLAMTKRTAAGPGYYISAIFMGLVGIFLLTKGFYLAIYPPSFVG